MHGVELLGKKMGVDTRIKKCSLVVLDTERMKSSRIGKIVYEVSV